MCFWIINGLFSSSCRSRCWKPKPIIFLLHNNGFLAKSDRVERRASYSQPASLFFSGHNQELQTVEILISAFEGNHLFPQMTHFRIYLWFRVDWERFPDTKSWGTMARCHCLRCPGHQPGRPGHVDLGKGPIETTSDVQPMRDSHPHTIGLSSFPSVYLIANCVLLFEYSVVLLILSKPKCEVPESSIWYQFKKKKKKSSLKCVIVILVKIWRIRWLYFWQP